MKVLACAKVQGVIVIVDCLLYSREIVSVEQPMMWPALHC